MVDRVVAPFPKSISLLSLSRSKLYNRRMAGSKDDVAREPIDLRSKSKATNLFDYEELEWNVSEESIPREKSVENYYGSNSERRPESADVGYQPLYSSRVDRISGRNLMEFFVFRRITEMSLDHMYCSRCREGFEPHEKIVNSNGELWHPQCFV